jgi:hypothetical protein
MNWAIVAQLIITEGIPVAADLIEKWEKGTPVTSEEFSKTRAIASTTAKERIQAQLVKAGIDLDSEAAKRLLDMAGT